MLFKGEGGEEWEEGEGSEYKEVYEEFRDAAWDLKDEILSIYTGITDKEQAPLAKQMKITDDSLPTVHHHLLPITHFCRS